jgi:hypothetical protein
LDVTAFGGCQDEALNNLTDEIRERDGAPTADENSFTTRRAFRL